MVTMDVPCFFDGSFIVVGEWFISALMYTVVVLYHDDYSEMVIVLYSFIYNF